MEYFVLGDEDTVLGFRYAGVAGKVVRTPDEARSTLSEQVAAGRVGVIIATDAVVKMIEAEFNKLMLESRVPLVVRIPGPGGPSQDRPDLVALIREALGIKF